MAVSRCTITGIDYWKIYRRWGEETVQRYIRVNKPNERESRKKADAEDESLRSRQRAYFARQVYQPDYHVNEKGQIRGIRRVTVKRAGRQPKEYFQARIKLPWEDEPEFTSVSIDKWGIDLAHEIMVEWYSDQYGFEGLSVMRSVLRETLAAYKSKMKFVALPERVTESADDGWSDLEKEIAAFKQRDKKAISGR